VVHLVNAEARARASGRVAFGSSKIEFFRGLGQSVGTLPVYIVASRTGHERLDAPRLGIAIGRVVFTGTLAGVRDADARGRHPDPALRVDTTLLDGAWSIFWEVTGLERLETPLNVSNFSTKGGQQWRSTPEGPVLAKRNNH
jgi:hypothetical protein